MEIRVLGALEIQVGGRAVALTAHKQQLALGVLVCHPGRAVTIDEFVEALWAEHAPPSARANVRSYIHFLKQALGDTPGPALRDTPRQTLHDKPRQARKKEPWIERRPSGYALVASGEIDSVRFQGLAESGHSAVAAGDAERGMTLLGRALALWRGPAFAGLTDATVIREEAARLERLRQLAVERQIEVRLALGQHAELLPELGRLVADHPLRERFRAQLMTALYRCGLQSEALDVYRTGRATLLAELGLEPSEELRALERAILTHDRRLDFHPPTATPGNRPPATPSSAPGAASSAAATPRVPAQLPLDVPTFAGREDELARLDRILAAAERARAMAIAAVSGAAGIGKTALAVHWAHRIASRFPDGQLYVNLRGFDPSGSPLAPAEAVRGFLDALDVPPERIPVSMDAQAACYRSQLAGRRMLLLLDNARDADQVRPLLPGSATCFVVVTSRSQLTGLVAGEGAHAITLDLLTHVEAGQLLIRRLGAERVTAEPQPTNEIIARCARLPLALAVVAARAASHPAFPLAAFAGELRVASGGLDAFDGGDTTADIRAVFSWSHCGLSAPAARLYRLLGLHPGPDIAAGATASLAGVPHRTVRPVLAELVRAHLVAEHVPGRFACHDLLRAYATEQARLLDSDGERRAALHRVLDHYLHTAHVAALLLEPYRDPLTLVPAQSGVTTERIANRAHAFAWFRAEHAVLVSAIRSAADSGFDTHAWQLAWTLADFLDRRGLWRDQIDVQRIALAAARRAVDRSGQAHAERYLGSSYARLRRKDEAYKHFQHALHLFGDIGNQLGQAHLHLSIASVLGQQDRQVSAFRHARQALNLYRTAGHRAGQARALNALGWYYARLGNYENALNSCEEALVLQREIDDRVGEGSTLDSIGFAYSRLGRHREAVACYQQALELRRQAGYRHGEAAVLVHLGEAHKAADDLTAERATLQRALEIFDELEHPEADRVRARLRRLDEASALPGAAVHLHTGKGSSIREMAPFTQISGD